MRTKRKVPFPSLRGFVAAPPSAHGVEFSIIVEAAASSPFERLDSLAIVDVCGPLVQHATFLYPSYDDLRASVNAALASDASTIVLRIDSPGGDFAGCLEVSRYIRERARTAGKRLVAFTDSAALSAAYAIACACDEIVITSSAFVGSVGVWAALADETAADRARGLNIAVVSSGAQKAERNSHVPITEQSIANLQAEVDAMAGLFFDVVSDLRGIPRSTVEALEGGQIFGASAVSASLADRVVNDFEEFVSTIGERAMAKSYKEARAGYRSTLAKLAAEDSDEGKAARSALAAMDQEDEKAAKKAAEEEEKTEAKGEGEDPAPSERKEKAAAPAEEEKKAESESESEKKAAASAASPAELALTARIHALEVAIAKRDEDAERERLLATRPDFSASVRATLARASVATVREACKTWERGVLPHEATNAALTPAATRGATDPASETIARETVGEYIDRKLGGSASAGRGIKRRSNEVELGFMTPEEAREFLAAQSKESK